MQWPGCFVHAFSGVSFNSEWVFSGAYVSQLQLLACGRGVAGGSHSDMHVSANSLLSHVALPCQLWTVCLLHCQ
jgi:hypothetical protein